MSEPLVSIITPTYNCRDYIISTINSVIAQTYKRWEMIIVDDCSTDNSLNLIQDTAKIDDRIKLISLNKNVGAAKARNKALEIARGRFIAFLDSDDVWMPEKLEIQIGLMIKNNYPISFTRYSVYSEDLSTYRYTIKVPDCIDYSGYVKNTIIGMSTAIINKEIVGLFSFYDIRMRQDAYLWITLLKRGYLAYGINRDLTKYRLRELSISANKLKAAKMNWFIYFHLEKLGFLKASYYFGCYAYNATFKRIINK